MRCYLNITQETLELTLDQLQAKLIGREALQLESRVFLNFDNFKAELISAFSFGKDLNNYRDDIINVRKTPTNKH